ncbi:aldehyde dehydrogenase family protein, partial [Bacteroidota bacterium]|nr:aldehyde dehydrogenase family protein [Bacteroidota bacterium]
MSSTIQPLEFNGNWELSPSLESTDHLSLKNQYGLFINGNFVKPLSKKFFPTINPSNEATIAMISEAEEKDVNLAVKSARVAYDGHWSKMPNKERAKYIYRIARMIQEKSKELSVIETLDGGKPIRESRDIDIPLAAAHFFYYAGWADKLKYAFPIANPKPVGVAGQIIPWNFPLMMAAWKIAPALATGN